jgi:hypothetical protein
MDSTITTTKLDSTTGIDCACVLHGNAYDWVYVQNLYNMLTRHISIPIRFHVYTEIHRHVPGPWIKHVLPNWQIGGPRTSWWYKLQLFDSQQHQGPLLYFDLDTVIVNNIDWIWQLPTNSFWAVRDFKYLWRPAHYAINSSIMWWDTRCFDYVWQQFQQENLNLLIKKYRGDQDYITDVVENKKVQFLDSEKVKSWRWQCLGGVDGFKRRIHQKHGTVVNTDTVIPDNTDIMVFHGQPKPLDLRDPVIYKHWT